VRKSAQFISQCLKEAQGCLRHGNTRHAAEALDRLNGSAPHDPEALGLYGRLLHDCGRFSAAVSVLERTIQLAPNTAAHWSNLGAACQATGNPAAAVKAYHRAIALDASGWEAYFNLGNLLEIDGDYRRAESCQRHCVQRNPGYAPGWAALARLLARQGKYEEAIACFDKSLAIDPTPTTYCNLAQTLANCRRFPLALAAAGKAIALDSLCSRGYYQAAKALAAMDRIAGSRQAYEAALVLEPDSTEVMEGLGNAAQLLAEPEEAVRWYVRAMELRPASISAYSGLLFTLSANAAAPPERLLEVHRDWARMYASRFPRFQHTPKPRDADRRLRIGFVSGDFREHSVRFFIAPILRGLDRRQFEVICYSNCPFADAGTLQIHPLADEWHSVAHCRDDELAELIRGHGIDILFDLSGHTQDNRLLVFARKPAPIQISYLGYLGTTGLEEMDYWITDWIVHPADTLQRTSERIWRLPRCWVAYEPFADAPAVAVRDAGAPITFASFNALQKLGPPSIRLWARVLEALPESQLLIKSHGLDNPEERAMVMRRLADAGVAAERVTLMGRIPSRAAHLELFGKVDIALDTTPWAGGTTTAETLWMGVPLVTLPGPLMPSRMSASMLHAVGLDDLVARDEAGFARIAVDLARDPERRSKLRLDLRGRMAASPLCDGPGLAREMGIAFREMWKIWCGSEAAES
jgi:predicted O-linked N-acetylglucosamine transferase (SPINDLY family)